jgi:hypothetical protein
MFTASSWVDCPQSLVPANTCAAGLKLDSAD